ncbi:type I restriction endonuclease subunit S [Aliivibrio fischeri]|uniref:Type I restriction endonuclease subunit S n=1 Tax=Aliivibrio fischeri TaxID=668 RepID=A0A6N3YZI4_ALIFS|nr:restriction endonuclease subunit S [Aliivibrio fischeri]MUK45117.1 type I restriction endonuclease subunit S [Aliivibrio fischeri]MUK80776.1 type I restriction endonuclease subunit S [Aliivibrio fischeri]MUK84215.1 type I restriction endonuclease subunit S [Aliivibrio fischeri]
MSSLPKGWANSELCNITEVVSGNAFKSKDFVENGIPVVKISNVQSGKYIEKNQEYLPDSFVNESNARFIVNHNDLLIALTRPIVSNKLKVCTYPNKKQVGLLNQRVARLDVYEGSSECFLHYYLSSKGFKESVQASMSETLQPNLSPKSLSKIRIDYPPLAEQKRIVEKLDEVLAQVDTIKARLDCIPSLLKRFRQSVLASAVSGKLTEEFRTEWLEEKIQLILSLQPTAKTRRGVPDNVPIDEDLLKQEIPKQWVVESVARLLKLAVITDVKDGNHGANHPKSSEFVDDGIPFITAAQMNDKGHIDFEGAPKLKGEPLSKLKVGFAESQDVIYSHKGTVGRVSVSDRDCILSPQTTYYRLNQTFIIPRYLAVYLQSQQYKNQVNKVKTQTTRDFVSISAQYQMTILLPLIEEQKEIVRLVDQYFAFADTIEAQVKKAQARVDNLTQSILAKAFRGELVPQDPNDEPADKLLERIAQARSEAEALAKAAKKAETARKKAQKV